LVNNVDLLDGIGHGIVSTPQFIGLDLVYNTTRKCPP